MARLGTNSANGLRRNRATRSAICQLSCTGLPTRQGHRAQRWTDCEHLVPRVRHDTAEPDRHLPNGLRPAPSHHAL